MYHIIIIISYLKKYIVNQKILTNKMCLEFDFTYVCYANFITIGEPPIVLYIYENYNRDYLKK